MRANPISLNQLEPAVGADTLRAPLNLDVMSRTLDYIEELISKRRSVWIAAIIIAAVCLPAGAYNMWKPKAKTMGYSHGHSLNPTPVSKDSDFGMGFVTFTFGIGAIGFAYWYHRRIGKEILIEGKYMVDHEDT